MSRFNSSVFLSVQGCRESLPEDVAWNRTSAEDSAQPFNVSHHSTHSLCQVLTQKSKTSLTSQKLGWLGGLNTSKGSFVSVCGCLVGRGDERHWALWDIYGEGTVLSSRWRSERDTKRQLESLQVLDDCVVCLLIRNSDDPMVLCISWFLPAAYQSYSVILNKYIWLIYTYQLQPVARQWLAVDKLLAGLAVGRFVLFIVLSNLF